MLCFGFDTEPNKFCALFYEHLTCHDAPYSPASRPANTSSRKSVDAEQDISGAGGAFTVQYHIIALHSLNNPKDVTLYDSGIYKAVLALLTVHLLTSSTYLPSNILFVEF